jgi:NhaA family Na+:H+ antiporter
VVGAALWLAVLRSGVHPTLAGVALGLLTPTGVLVGRTTLRLAAADLAGKLKHDEEEEIRPHDLELLRFTARESVSPVERLENALHPWVAFVIMPLFALANAGVAVNANAAGDPVALAVVAGLVLGKPIGIVGFSYLAVQTGLARRPTGVNWKHLTAAGCLGGIGFTMSLFIAGLAFPPPNPHVDAAKVGILLGSLMSASLGTGLLLWAMRAKVG